MRFVVLTVLSLKSEYKVTGTGTPSLRTAETPPPADMHHIIRHVRNRYLQLTASAGVDRRTKSYIKRTIDNILYTQSTFSQHTQQSKILIYSPSWHSK